MTVELLNIGEGYKTSNNEAPVSKPDYTPQSIEKIYTKEEARESSETKTEPKNKDAEIEKAILYLDDIQKMSSVMNKKIVFDIDYKENEILVQIRNKETNELIRQLPPEELRRLHKRLKETIEMMGLIIDKLA